MDKNDIIPFLMKAKKATYAGKGAETISSRLKSHDLVYSEDDLMYYDTYLGGDKFAGEEALWISGNPYWSMNYAGRVIGDNFSGDFEWFQGYETISYKDEIIYECYFHGSIIK